MKVTRADEGLAATVVHEAGHLLRLILITAQDAARAQ